MTTRSEAVPGLVRRFDKLERQKGKVLDDLARWSPAALAFRPAADAWSAIDVLSHLVKMEQTVLGAVRQELPLGHRVVFRDRMRALMVNAVMRSPARIQVPASGSVVLPEPAGEIGGNVAAWGEVRCELRTLIDEFAPANLASGVFHHPVAGWMTLEQTLGFLSAHLQHHTYQLARLKAGAGDAAQH